MSDGLCPVCATPFDEMDVYQPLGFRTDYSPKDAAGDDDKSASADRPVLGWVGAGGDPDTLHGLRLQVHEQASLLVVNDNRGRLYEFTQGPHKSVVVKDVLSPGSTLASGASRGQGGIGELRVTDAVVMWLESVRLPTGTIATISDRCRGGMPALASFAEAVRRAAQSALDVDASELAVGLQPRVVNGERTQAVYVADTLDNGAGYAIELSSRTSMEAVLAEIRGAMANVWESVGHEGCDSSCPDCLRSWDNRFVHPLLDWRLALDVAELASGLPLTTSRWLDRSVSLAEGLAVTFRDVARLEVGRSGGLTTLIVPSARKTVVIGHPLWGRLPGTLSPEQEKAIEAVAATGMTAELLDVRTLTRSPVTLVSAIR